MLKIDRAPFANARAATDEEAAYETPFSLINIGAGGNVLLMPASSDDDTPAV